MKVFFAFLLLLSVSTTLVKGQGAIDGFFNPKGKSSLAISYTRGSFDEFYAGTDKQNSVPAHEEISQDIINFYWKYGVKDNLNLIASVPYIRASSDAGPDPINGETEVESLQDLSLYLTWNPYSSAFGSLNVDYIAALGLTTPLTNYEPNGILSIGSGAASVNPTLGVNIKHNSGFFVTLTAAYSLRGDAEKDVSLFGGIDPDAGVTPDDFNVPDAWLFSAKAGYSFGKFYVDVFSDSQFSNSDGIDITDADFGGKFPGTRVNYTRLGFSAYANVGDGFGVSVGYSTITDGRNIGDLNYASAALVFDF
ncbi:MAG: transporter [Bacteroidota bacterium]